MLGQVGSLDATFFAVKPVKPNVGFFDDAPMHQQTLWGTPFTVPTHLGQGGRADLYYIGNDYNLVSYDDRLPARETRHTLGIQSFRPIGQAFDYNWEVDFPATSQITYSRVGPIDGVRLYV